MLRFYHNSLAVLFVAVLVVAIGGCQTRPPETARTDRRAGTKSAPGIALSPGALHSTDTPAYCPPVTPEIAYEPAPTAAWQALAGKTVILDAGHGGHDEGACHFGLREKDINLDLAHRTAFLLRQRGCTVIMTRSSDDFISLPDRSAVANRYPNATLVSIHVNAAEGNPGVSGIETFVLSSEFSDQERSRVAASRFRVNGVDSVQGKQALANLTVTSRNRAPALAESLQRSLTSRLGETNRGVKQKNLAVLRETYLGPAVLVEVGFMTNPRSADRMRSGLWRVHTPEALCEGICSFLQQPL